MPWRPNESVAFRERITIASAAAIVAGVLASLIAGWLLPVVEPGERVAVGLLVGFVLAFLGTAPVWAALEILSRPTAMALTERGVHFWYPTPEERQLADGFVAWREIAFIGIRGSGKNSRRALERKNGVTDRPDFLTSENWDALVEEWKRRGPVST